MEILKFIFDLILSVSYYILFTIYLLRLLVLIEDNRKK